ncbi:ATP synthase F1 subunit epsilon [Mariprofundus erugo]|nr:ATP synthase F1 subunit epsilon [Mariprofundus erugo]
MTSGTCLREFAGRSWPAWKLLPVAFRHKSIRISSACWPTRNNGLVKILVATVEKEVYRGEACSVTAPSVGGEIMVMKNHAPLLAVLRPGVLRIDCPPGGDCPYGRRDEMVIVGGYIEVQPDAVTVLADAVERAHEIDAKRAEKAVRKAREAYQSAPADDHERLLLELEVALARLHLVMIKR